MHPRQTIRHALRQRLRGADGAHPTAAGRKVYASRAVPVMASHLPALLIYTTSDRRDTRFSDAQDGVIRHILTVAVEVAAAGEDADDQVDSLCAEVEAVLATDANLGGAVESLTWQQTEIDLAGDGDAPVVAARMEWEAVYYTVPAEEDAGTPPPSGVYASWAPDIGLPHEDDYVDISNGQLPDVSPNDGT